MGTLIDGPLAVINVGLPSFADAVSAVGGTALHVEWAPPAAADPALAAKLAALIAHPQVESANQAAFDRYLAADPVLVGVARAGDVTPALHGRALLHAGPPVAWDAMCGPMQGAVIGAALFEEWAADPAAAEALAASGAIHFAPCHEHGAVGPMAGILSPSMPVWVVENRSLGNRAFSGLNEGLGKVLRFGAYGREVIARLRWMQSVLAPALAATLAVHGPLELKPLMAQALHMGDELHNRNVAASGLLLKRLLPALLRTGVATTALAEVATFITGNDHFFLNLSMAACKAMLDAAHGVPASSLVTAMARNGVTFGIRVSGLGDTWFTAPAPTVRGLFFPGFTAADGAPDLGDSAITETAGLGGFAMAAAPAIVQFVGGTPAAAVGYTQEMAEITLGANRAFTLPALNFGGTPAGIDCRAVVDTGIAPVINTGIAHRQAGVGQVGAGITRAPLACFAQAVAALAGEVTG